MSEQLGYPGCGREDRKWSELPSKGVLWNRQGPVKPVSSQAEVGSFPDKSISTELHLREEGSPARNLSPDPGTSPPQTVSVMGPRSISPKSGLSTPRLSPGLCVPVLFVPTHRHDKWPGGAGVATSVPQVLHGIKSLIIP